MHFYLFCFFLILLCCKPNIVSETCVVNAVKNVFIFSRTTSAIFKYYAFVDFKLTCNQKQANMAQSQVRLKLEQRQKWQEFHFSPKIINN